MKISRSLALFTILLAVHPAFAADPSAAKSFHFVDGDGYRELLFGDKPIYRYVNKYDPADRDNTLKPFHHLYGLHREGYITKGPGGLYTHHRGIFFGFKTQHGDFWHCRDVLQQHQRYLPDREHVDDKSARCAQVIDWIDKDSKPAVRDTRDVTVTRPSDDQVVLDFDITVENLRDEPLQLGGDPQHAGFQFRAHNDVSGADQKSGKTGTATYLRPEGAQFTKNDEWLNCNWAACSFKVKGNPYTVVHMDHPSNPRPITYSTRPYARFGSYGPTTVDKDKPLKLRYRLILLDGKTHPNPTTAEFEKQYQDFKSKQTASAIP
jgi:hypothetical protein